MNNSFITNATLSSLLSISSKARQCLENSAASLITMILLNKSSIYLNNNITVVKVDSESLTKCV